MMSIFGGGVVAKAKKKKPAGAASKAPAGPSGDERVAVIVLKGSPDYRGWLSRISDESLIPVAAIVRDALRKWAKERGFPAPPER